MKNRIPAFISGMITMAIILSLAVGTLAASGIQITVDPTIKIMVNGEVFKPKDVNGKDVMTFVYGGTTYAPVRAMAEAFDLKVGYDAEKKMATVGEAAPSTSTEIEQDERSLYQGFKGMWDIDISDISTHGVKLTAKNSINKLEFISWFENTDYSTVKKMSQQFSDELIQKYVIPTLSAPGVYNSFTTFYFDKTLLWQQSKLNFDLETDEYSINNCSYDLKHLLQQLQ